MTGRYMMRLEAWPYSTGAGQAADQAAVGPREREFEIRASGFDDAYRQAKLIQQGVLSHDRVWEAPIKSIDFKGSR